MKEAVLRLLKKNCGAYVSGEEICKSLQVTRTAIWKHIQALREDGYEIEARPRVGYQLTGTPDRLNPEEIKEGLSTRIMGQNKIFYYSTISSTNKIAQEEGQRGCAEGTLVVAEEQTGGRGRLGRVWSSPRYKGIFLSLVLRPLVNPAQVAQVTMVASVALAMAIRTETGVVAGIKWPNDLLAHGKKVCGISADLNAEMDRVNYLVLGAGINANQQLEDFPVELRDTATSLKIETGRPVDRAKLTRACLESFEHWYTLWLDEGFGPVLSSWKEMSVSLNCPVRIHTLNKSWEGWAEDIDVDGALLLRLPNGEIQRLVSGEVSLRIT
ncbi:Bifunctional ligase/repressor BirA [Pelotomaculum sp. FP]|uniref:biotin--[acetyl-CoA-carboxylase] ligase n=1 Tax=Pelotomaculum sp. FP TaxID=261474 RepID=UPI0011028E1E|nr:biotin--[acetyl-CoA-carboxylase] ligase [Pelotomaculum sp. FP]TEB17246.1 Bifunctional ligase/repressor BirA [Pelotomaculum sp. FP]